MPHYRMFLCYVQLALAVHIPELGHFDGPFEIAHVISDVTVIIRSIAGKLYKSHVDQLRPWLGWDPASESRAIDETPRDLGEGETPIVGRTPPEEVAKKQQKR